MDPSKAAALSRDVTTPLATLEELAESDLPFLREDVACHPNVSSALLLRLIPSSLEREADVRVAMAVVSNPRTPSEGLFTVIQLLRADRLDGSRRENWLWENLAVAALSHRNSRDDEAVNAIESLQLPKSLKIRLAKSRANKGVLDYLSRDRSESVRIVAASVLKSDTEQLVGRGRR